MLGLLRIDPRSVDWVKYCKYVYDW